MKTWMVDFFGNYAHELIFLHVISAVIWVGGMIAIRLAVHPNLQLIEDPRIRLERTLAITGRFFNIVLPFILMIVLTAVIMAVGLGFRAAAVDMSGNIISEPAYATYQIVHVKEVIWLIMTLNFSWMYYKRRKAQKLFDSGELPAAKEAVAPIPRLLLPVNIILGISAIWLGITLRGF